MRDAIDVLRTFASFASCLTEVLSTGSKNDRVPEATVHRSAAVAELLASGDGLIFVTAHTAGWEAMGALLAREHRRRVMIVMQRERDPAARALHDAAREAQRGVQVAHVGGDPLASLPRCDTCGRAASSRSRSTGSRGGWPVARCGSSGDPGSSRRGLCASPSSRAPPSYRFLVANRSSAVRVHFCEPVHVARRAVPAELDVAAQALADALGAFVSAHPTDWFAFDA